MEPTLITMISGIITLIFIPVMGWLFLRAVNGNDKRIDNVEEEIDDIRTEIKKLESQQIEMRLLDATITEKLQDIKSSLKRIEREKENDDDKTT